MVLAMLLMTVTQGAWAQTWTEVNSESALNSAISNGAHIRLTDDITLSSHILVYGGYTVTIDLGGHTLSRDLTVATYNGDMIEVYDTGSLTMMNGTLTGGYNNRTDEYSSGCIYNKGTVILTDVVITGCKGDDGGAIRNQEGAALTITGGAITDCESLNHGGGAIVNYGTVNISNCSLSGNTASTRGGAIWSNNTLTMSGCTINGNEALDNSGDGGGLHIEGGTATLTDVTITSNTSKDAGGIYVKAGATLSLGGSTGSTLSGNTSSAHGGGGIVNYGTLSLSGTVSITGNTCYTNGGGIWNNATDATLNMQGAITVSGNNGSGGSTTSNIYLNGSSVITVTGEIASNSSIGLSRASSQVEAYTSGFGENNPSLTGTIAFFTDDSDSENYSFVVSEEIFRCPKNYGNDVTDGDYVDDAGAVQTRTNCIKLSSITDQSGVTLYPGWYVVDEDLTFSNRITAVGEVHLILANDTELEAQKGIYVPHGTMFHIWGQTDDQGMLTIDGIGSENYAGIGGDKYHTCGGIRIHGGSINAQGGGECPGIGGASRYGIIISGGSIYAHGYMYSEIDDSQNAYGGAGIGGCAAGLTPDILITGGSVIAIGGLEAAGIGGGCENLSYSKRHEFSDVPGEEGSIIRITGGNITAWGSKGGAGIGGGASSGRNGAYRGLPGYIFIDGGTVKAYTLKNDGATYESQAIGHGRLVNKTETLVPEPRIYDNAKVSATTDDEGTVSPVSKHERINALGWAMKTFYKKVGIEPCDHSGATIGITDGLKHSVNCTYCSQTAEPHTFGSYGECDACHLVSLADRADNSEAISHWNGEAKSIALTDRTLYKDGKWNTLTLPFDLTLSGSALDGAEAHTVSSASISGSTLNLTFSEVVSTLEAGTPYIIKWTKADDYVDDDAHNIVNPVFNGVTVSIAKHDYDNNVSGDNRVRFLGTYECTAFDAVDNSILLMSGNNTLYYPASGAGIGAQRAYFKIGEDGALARLLTSFNFDFGGDGNTTGIFSVQGEGFTVNSSNGWYTLGGQKLQGKPVVPGIYIINGKKIVIKRSAQK